MEGEYRFTLERFRTYIARFPPLSHPSFEHLFDE